MSGEQLGLLGVGAEARDDDQVDAVGPRRRVHPVERLGDVGAHALAVAVEERTAVPTATGHGRRALGGPRWGGGFGDGGRFDLARLGAHLDRCRDDRLRLDRRE